MAIAKVDAVRTNAHPTDDPSGVSRNQRKMRHVLCHHRPGTDKGISPDGNTAHDGTVGAESRTSANQGRTQFIHAPDFATRIKHVGEDHRRSAEHVIIESHAFINGDVILDFDPVANVHIGPNDNILSYPTILANL